MYIKQAHSTQQNAWDLPNYFKKIDFKFERLVQVRMNNINFTSDDSSSFHVQLIIRINSKIMKIIHSHAQL